MMNINYPACLAIASLLFLHGVHSAEVVRCVDTNGEVTYSDKSCASTEDESIIVINPSPARENTTDGFLATKEYIKAAEQDREKKEEENARRKAKAREECTRVTQRYQAALDRSRGFIVPAPRVEGLAEAADRAKKYHREREAAGKLAQSLERRVKECWH